MSLTAGVDLAQFYVIDLDSEGQEKNSGVKTKEGMLSSNSKSMFSCYYVVAILPQTHSQDRI